MGMRQSSAVDYPRGITFEQVWAALDRTNMSLAETDRIVKENAEGLRELREAQRKAALAAEQTHKAIGDLSNRFGEVVESMVVPTLVQKFRELGFEFEKAGPDVRIFDKAHDIQAEVDAFLENGDKVMIVETKSKPNMSDVRKHVKKMNMLRRYADLKNDKRKYLGAIAGVIVSYRVKEYALETGFYVIEPSGETFSITAPEGRHKAREW